MSGLGSREKIEWIVMAHGYIKPNAAKNSDPHDNRDSSSPPYFLGCENNSVFCFTFTLTPLNQKHQNDKQHSSSQVYEKILHVLSPVKLRKNCFYSTTDELIMQIKR